MSSKKEKKKTVKKLTPEEIKKFKENKSLTPNQYVVLDGIKIKLQAPDLDGDGETGGTEVMTRNVGGQGLTQVIQPSEMAETLKTLNSDSLDPNTGMSSIDMNTRMNVIERNGIVGLDSLVQLKVCPPECLAFTRQMKRLNVSLGGQGRKETVDIVAGERSHKEGMGQGGFVDKIKGAFGGGGK